jgi:uncharacterized membrane protein YgcG
MRGTFTRSLLVVAALGLVTACEELVPPEPEQPAPVVAKPVKKQPVVAAPAVKKKPVVIYDEGSDSTDGGSGGDGGFDGGGGGGGGGWEPG